MESFAIGRVSGGGAYFEASIDWFGPASIESFRCSIVGESFLSSEQLSEKDIDKIFSRAALFKKEFQKRKRFDHLLARTEDLHQKVIALVFAEPSTRTRMSFQVAAGRLGMRSLALDNPQVASLSKGETLDDTIRNVAAMLPRF
ncbi:MAG: hypothetical protein HC902_02280 [Calothrix sp. SM1_5_4]|nr:hypothetical protein [Calothrix sp. SM1_5_4]